MKQKLSQYIADFLVKNGISDVFTITGGGAMHLNDALGHHENLNCIYQHHEQACAIAAEAYSRLSGKLPVVCVTSGPGGTNAITGVLGGWLDSIPMFVISGQVKRETTVGSTSVPLRQLGDQEFPIIDCVKTMTKYAIMVTSPEEIRYHLEKALFLCLNGRGGPVWLDIPIDVQAAIIETDTLVGFDKSELEKKENPVYDKSLTGSVLERIKNAKRPVIIAGTGIRLGKAHAEFLTLLDKLQIPVVTAWNAHDNVSDDNPYYVGRPSTVGNRGGNFVVENADLLLVLGCRLNIRQISYNYKDFAKNAYKIVVDIDESELRKPTISVDLAIHANVKDVILDLLQSTYLPINTHSIWLNWCKKINFRFPIVLPSYFEKSKPLNPYAFVDKLFSVLDKNSTVVCSNGSACVITFQAAKIKNGQRLFTNSGCASMGYGLPAAIGACFSNLSNPVVCIEGDGSLQMNIQELQTLRYHQLNLKLFVFNNDGYHSIRQTQSNLFSGELIGVNKSNGVSFPDLEKIANAYDIAYMRLDSLENMEQKINEVLSLTKPIICDVVLDIKQNFEPKVSSKVHEDGTITSAPLDDMYPFLPQEDYLLIKKEIGFLEE